MFEPSINEFGKIEGIFQNFLPHFQCSRIFDEAGRRKLMGLWYKKNKYSCRGKDPPAPILQNLKSENFHQNHQRFRNLSSTTSPSFGSFSRSFEKPNAIKVCFSAWIYLNNIYYFFKKTMNGRHEHIAIILNFYPDSSMLLEGVGGIRSFFVRKCSIFSSLPHNACYEVVYNHWKFLAFFLAAVPLKVAF